MPYGDFREIARTYGAARRIEGTPFGGAIQDAVVRIEGQKKGSESHDSEPFQVVGELAPSALCTAKRVPAVSGSVRPRLRLDPTGVVASVSGIEIAVIALFHAADFAVAAATHDYAAVELDGARSRNTAGRVDRR